MKKKDLDIIVPSKHVYIHVNLILIHLNAAYKGFELKTKNKKQIILRLNFTKLLFCHIVPRYVYIT